MSREQDERELSERARRAAQLFDWNTVGDSATRILERNPDAAEGHFLRGLHFKGLGQHRPALQSFSAALKLDEGRYDAAIEMADQLVIAQNNAAALNVLEVYVPLLSNSPRYLDMAATVFDSIGLPERAWPLYKRATTLQPDIELFRANLAACSAYLGRIDDAEALYRGLLSAKPSHQRNHHHLSRLKKATDRSHVDWMISILAREQLPPDRNVFLYFAIAKELEDLQQWDLAFDYYARGCDAVSSRMSYDVSKDIQIIDRIISVFTVEWFAEIKPRRPQNPEKTPIFIVGLPRTGTTLVERILECHSSVQSLGETQFLPRAVRDASGCHTREQIALEIIDACARIGVDRIAETYLSCAEYRLGPERFFIEKLPYNDLYLGLIAKAFPGAKLVSLRRHPMDACFSMYKQVFTWAYKYSYSQENLARYYAAHVRLHEHWKNVLGDRLIEVSYEELIREPEPQIRALLQALGLEFEPECLNFHSNPSACTTASAMQVRRPIYPDSVGKWHRFATHLEPLRVALLNEGIPVP